MGVMPKVIPGSTNPVAAAADAVGDLILARYNKNKYGALDDAAVNDGLNNPLTNMTRVLVILNGLMVDDILRLRVTVVGVKSCSIEILKLLRSNQDDTLE